MCDCPGAGIFSCVEHDPHCDVRPIKIPVVVWSDREIDWRIRDSRPKAGVGATSNILHAPVLGNDT